MKKIKQTSIGLAIFVLMLLFYIHHIKRDKEQINKYIWNRNQLGRVQTKYNNRYLIRTQGCTIPDYYEELKYQNILTDSSCKQRAIFVRKISESKIKFEIDKTRMKKYWNVTENYLCCYQTVNRSRISRGEDSYVSYSPCTNFKSGTTAKFNYEVIKIICTVYYKNKSEAIIYDDVYINLRKVKLSTNKIKKKAWNILLLGMDTMSRTRFLKTMPRSTKLIKQTGWLDYQGYHTISFENFYNLMALLTGENKLTIDKKCEFGLDYCINETLWGKFHESGYVTAYGEDFVHSESSTFSRYYGFTTLPADHYMKPLFLSGETREGDILCTKKMPSVNHLLDYAFQFIDVYKKDNYFGVFWHNTYSNVGYIPKFIDNAFVDFFHKINKTTILDNTFIFFMSNHGITRGEFKIRVGSYYEERLPILFIWVPNNFRKKYVKKYRNMQMNQNSLTSPYDVFVTLTNILKLSTNSPISTQIDACPNYTSVFEEIPSSRTCLSAGIDEKYCTCHDVMEMNREQGAEALDIAVSYIKELTIKIETIPFSRCAMLELDSVLRIHTYRSRGNEYIIVAFTMMPGNYSFEALLTRYDKKYNILEPVEGISAYNRRGSCVIDIIDRAYCLCEMSNPCVV